jgi:hypothetical protein
MDKSKPTKKAHIKQLSVPQIMRTCDVQVLFMSCVHRLYHDRATTDPWSRSRLVVPCRDLTFILCITRGNTPSITAVARRTFQNIQYTVTYLPKYIICQISTLNGIEFVCYFLQILIIDIFEFLRKFDFLSYSKYYS